MTYPELARADANLAAGEPPCLGSGNLFNSPYKSDHVRAKPICGMCPPDKFAHCEAMLELSRRLDGAAVVEGTWAGRLINPSSKGQAPGSRKQAAA